jgi:hypothetical protein
MKKKSEKKTGNIQESAKTKSGSDYHPTFFNFSESQALG